MNIKKEVSQLLHRYGNREDNFLIALPDVWLHYSTSNINILIENKEIIIKTELGYMYKFVKLYPIEQYSILLSLEQYGKQITDMLNKEFNEDLNY